MGSGAKTSMSKAPPRVMAPFRDTRMNQMAASEPSSPSASTAPTPDAAPSAHSTSGSGIGSIVPGALDLPGREPGAAESQATPVTDAVPVTTQDARDGASEAGAHSHGFGSSPGSELEANPPPLPHEGDAAAQHVEDATADLLRPMLRQWLTDNMPRMVEKALHIEVAETVRTSKNHDPS
ncbi:MAG: DUF2497 domain-containing protein [Alphaproteobacteria bacterium]|nr:DUF2497 domain-containing protein [Alphaproteobacteria bacterium]